MYIEHKALKTMFNKNLVECFSDMFEFMSVLNVCLLISTLMKTFHSFIFSKYRTAISYKQHFSN